MYLELTSHGDQVQSFSWKMDGSLIASSCKDKIIRIFDVRSKVAAQVEWLICTKFNFNYVYVCDSCVMKYDFNFMLAPICLTSILFLVVDNGRSLLHECLNRCILLVKFCWMKLIRFCLRWWLGCLLGNV